MARASRSLGCGFVSGGCAGLVSSLFVVFLVALIHLADAAACLLDIDVRPALSGRLREHARRRVRDKIAASGAARRDEGDNAQQQPTPHRLAPLINARRNVGRASAFCEANRCGPELKKTGRKAHRHICDFSFARVVRAACAGLIVGLMGPRCPAFTAEIAHHRSSSGVSEVSIAQVPAGLILRFQTAKRVLRRSSGGGHVDVQAVQEIARQAALAHSLPPDYFLALIRRESGFDPASVSPAGAQGIAQFMPATAFERGLKNPFDPVEALAKAAELLSELRMHFGNLGLAAAAYNAGPERVQRWLSGQASLPAETTAYVRVVTGHAPSDWAPSGGLPGVRTRPNSEEAVGSGTASRIGRDWELEFLITLQASSPANNNRASRSAAAASQRERALCRSCIAQRVY